MIESAEDSTAGQELDHLIHSDPVREGSGGEVGHCPTVQHSTSLSDSMIAYLNRVEAKRAQRLALTEARKVGLALRHAGKLRHLHQPSEGTQHHEPQ